MTPELTEAGVAAWLFKSRYEFDAKPPTVFYANDLRQARAVLALVEAKVREGCDTMYERWAGDAGTIGSRDAIVNQIVSRVMKGTT